MRAPLTWQKSTFSGGGSGEDCVEVAVSATRIHFRESDEPATVLTVTPTGLRALLAALKSR